MAAPAYPPPYVRAVGTKSAGASSCTPAWPTHTTGDIGVLIVNSGAATSVASITANSDGWAAAPNSPVAMSGTFNGSNPHVLTVFVCRATSGSMPTPTVSRTVAGDYIFAHIIVIRAADRRGAVTDAINASATAVHTGTNVSHSLVMPGVTPTVGSCLILHIATTGDDNASMGGSSPTNGNLFDLEEQLDDGDTTGGGGNVYVASGVRFAAVASGDTTVTLSTGSRQFARLTLAIMPPQLDASGPVVTADPVDASTIAATDSIQIDVVDDHDDDNIASIEVVAIHGDGTEDVVYSDSAFGSKYTDVANDIDDIADGKRLTIRRDDAGIPASSTTFRVTAADRYGNASVTEFSYTVTGAAPSGPPEIAIVSPADGETGPNTVWVVDVLGSHGGLAVAQASATPELILAGSSFLGLYSGCAREEVEGGYRYTLSRRGGWLSLPTFSAIGG